MFKRYAFIFVIIVTLLGWVVPPSSAPAAVRAVNLEQRKPEIFVVGQEWFRNPSPPSNAYPAFNAANENSNLVYGRYRMPPPPSAQQSNDSYSQGLSPEWSPDEQEKMSPEEFVYRIKIRNSGRKTIKAVLWDYVFMDPDTGKELSRHTFVSRGKVKFGETKTLTAFSSQPPTLVISARVLAKKESETYREQIVLKGIEYGDGTFWENNSDPGAVDE